MAVVNSVQTCRTNVIDFLHCVSEIASTNHRYKIRETLKTVLDTIGIPEGHAFHTFHRSGGILALDNGIQQVNNDPWSLVQFCSLVLPQNASQASSIIPCIFFSYHLSYNVGLDSEKILFYFSYSHFTLY